MICSKCKELDLKSTIQSRGYSRTLMGFNPFYDTEGVFHSHDENITTACYMCSNGHCITVKSVKKCPNCSHGEQPKEVTIIEFNK